ncbi:MAG TPA: phosphatidylinositol mannoside acyltransferase, partial [Acidimicrobiales bacterium]|nr:phosphatidylinositol mannoside acyltransferase [Acidimicrobiales bacterium]
GGAPPAPATAAAGRPPVGAAPAASAFSARSLLGPTFRYRLGACAASAVPAPVALAAARAIGVGAWAVLPARRAVVARHMSRATAGGLTPARAGRASREAFVSYARYWVESLRLPRTPPAEVDAHFTIDGREHLEEARAVGRGAVLALPHLGGWEVGGSWLARQGFPVSVVVESLEPPEVFEWFMGLRRTFGLSVIPLGPGAGTGVLAALRANHMVCLLCDRDIGGSGVEVEFFGERTTLPAGPATLALRARSVVLPTAVYFDGRGHHAVVEPPLTVERSGHVREDIVRLTQATATALEGLIRRAPEQWHLFQPNWPSDRLGSRHPRSPRPK